MTSFLVFLVHVNVNIIEMANQIKYDMIFIEAKCEFLSSTVAKPLIFDLHGYLLNNRQ